MTLKSTLNEIKMMAALTGTPLFSNRAAQVINEQPKINRNDPCPCGSGKKHKKCCGK